MTTATKVGDDVPSSHPVDSFLRFPPSVTFDPRRPCHSTSRAKNRYTKQELQMLCSTLHIPFDSKTTITTLCERLRANHQTNALVFGKGWEQTKQSASSSGVSSLQQGRIPDNLSQAMDVIHPAAFQEVMDQWLLTPSTQGANSLSNLPSLPLFQSDRPCDSKSRDKSRYTRTQLQSVYRNVFPEQTKTSIRKRTMDDLCRTLRDFFSTSAMDAPLELTKVSKNDPLRSTAWTRVIGPFVRKLRKRRALWEAIRDHRSFVFYSYKIRSKTFYRDDVPFESFLRRHTIKNSSSFFTLEKETLGTLLQNRIPGDCVVDSFAYFKHLLFPSSKEDPTDQARFERFGYESLVSLCVNEPWWKETASYTEQLSFTDQFILLSYTYHGDKFTVLAEDGSFDKDRYHDGSTTNNAKLYCDPLLGALLAACLADRLRTLQYFLDPSSPNYLTDKRYRVVLSAIGGYFPSTKEDMVKWYLITQVIHKKRIMTSELFTYLFTELKKRVDTIISQAPPLRHSLFLYRGTKERDFVRFKYHAIHKEQKQRQDLAELHKEDILLFRNRRLMSVSLEPKILTKAFPFTSSDCCGFYITLLPGTRCLPVFLTPFPEEREILVASDALMYATSPILRHPAPSGRCSQFVTVFHHHPSRLL